MTYQNFTKDVYKIINDALTSIIYMFKKKKVKEIEFQMPLAFKVSSCDGSRLMRFPKIFFKETIYLVDESGFTHPMYELVNKIDICNIYDNVYMYFHENVNVKHV